MVISFQKCDVGFLTIEYNWHTFTCAFKEDFYYSVAPGTPVFIWATHLKPFFCIIIITITQHNDPPVLIV